MYRFRRTMGVAMGLLLIVTMSGFASGGYADSPESAPTAITEEALKLVNNEAHADELIKTIYERSELKTGYSLANLLQELPPECVRYSNDMLYCIYKYDEDNYMFWFFDKDFYIMKWFLGKPLYLKDFYELQEKKATFREVREMDPDMFVSGTSSYHFTVDGYNIINSYSERDLSVYHMSIYSGAGNPYYHALLPIDKELIADIAKRHGKGAGIWKNAKYILIALPVIILAAIIIWRRRKKRTGA